MQHAITPSIVLLLFFVAFPRIVTADTQESTTSDGREVVPTPNKLQKIVIGEVEDVTLVPWGVNLPARIDTGADMSALDARNLTTWKNIADFRVGSLHLRLPVIEWRQIRTSVGSEVKPVVEIGICLGPKFFRTSAILGDRSNMAYPFLVGRNVLNGRFVVDTSQSKAVRTVCPPGSFLGEESASR
ncbi:MAG TPA: RimK/LysX family protein [Candidatus Acidoferrales bacterium]|nr:RimK/LysX family protein [Candidatus Acidoferrales bacterium]